MECIAVQAAQYLGGYKIHLTFNTGEIGDVDLEETIHRYEIARPLRDVNAFARFRLDAWPTLAWDCGFDIAPETLYHKAGFGASSAETYSHVAEGRTGYMKTP